MAVVNILWKYNRSWPANYLIQVLLVQIVHIYIYVYINIYILYSGSSIGHDASTAMRTTIRLRWCVHESTTFAQLPQDVITPQDITCWTIQQVRSQYKYVLFRCDISIIRKRWPHLNNGNPHTGKTAFLYWCGPRVTLVVVIYHFNIHYDFCEVKTRCCKRYAVDNQRMQ